MTQIFTESWKVLLLWKKNEGKEIIHPYIVQRNMHFRRFAES